jgi:hypothetical protein
MGSVPAKILVVDDEPQICSVTGCRLAAHGLDRQTTSDPRLAEELPAGQQFDVLIADIPELSLRSGLLPFHETLSPYHFVHRGIPENQLREECRCLVEP